MNDVTQSSRTFWLHFEYQTVSYSWDF